MQEFIPVRATDSAFESTRLGPSLFSRVLLMDPSHPLEPGFVHLVSTDSIFSASEDGKERLLKRCAYNSLMSSSDASHGTL
jgi:hypothetical protein